VAEGFPDCVSGGGSLPVGGAVQFVNRQNWLDLVNVWLAGTNETREGREHDWVKNTATGPAPIGT